MCLSLEHQNPSKTSDKKMVILIALQFRYTFYLPQTKGLRDRFTRHFGLGRLSGYVLCISNDMACGY